MKQEILCMECGDELKRTIKKYPGESYLFKEGKAIDDFLCDQCGNEIVPGSQCYAFSLWSVMGAIPYYPWEGEYITEVQP
ncbi:MAG TPA: hypothetical protein DDW42_01695 [Desulfobacteraceae bacterium]|nr:hypothetical protein [Desulfobacteraceae bacterium]